MWGRFLDGRETGLPSKRLDAAFPTGLAIVVDLVEAVFHGEDYEAGGISAARLHHDVGSVLLDGPLADEEAIGDFLIGLAVADLGEDVPLAL